VFTTLQPLYRDVDELGHINNISQAMYFDEARFRLSRLVIGRMETHPRLVTADSRVSYLAEVHYPTEVEIGAGILRLGSSAYDIGQAMFQNGACVAVCTTTFVHAPNGQAQPLPDAMRAILNQFLIDTAAERDGSP